MELSWNFIGVSCFLGKIKIYKAVCLRGSKCQQKVMVSNFFKITNISLIRNKYLVNFVKYKSRLAYNEIITVDLLELLP